MLQKLLPVILLVAIQPLVAQTASAAIDPQTASPGDIAVTPETSPATGTVAVNGEPRMTQGHPCTLWDQQDIDQLKEQLKTNAELQAAFTVLKTKADLRITQPLDVAVPEKAADGTWKYTGDLLPGKESAQKRTSHSSHANSNDIVDLGVMYVLTGDKSYGEYAKKLLLAYADGYNHYGHPPGWTPKNYRSAQDGRLTGQFLEDGFVLARMAFGYDLIYNLPSFTPADRAHIRDDLFKPIADEFFLLAGEHNDYISATHNRACLCTSAVLMAGYATDDPGLVNTALYGVGGTKEAPVGGVFGTHFSEKSLMSDGLWVEGSLSYQTSIASSGLFNDAETLWHHGIDMYRYRNGALKRMLDSAINLAYPDPRLIVAALHDGGRFSFLSDQAWQSNEIGVPYEYGYRRYGNPAYLPIIRNAAKSLSMDVHAGPPSAFFTLPDKSATPPRPVTSINFYKVGYGVLRLPNDGNPVHLLMEYGPSGSHSHPSKLGLDLYALGDTIMPFPGVIFPYQNPLDTKWYETTLANCTLGVDQASQVSFANQWKYPRGTPTPDAKQLVFAPAQTIGMQRAWSDTLYAGVTQDRSVFVTNNYVADIFGSFSATPHTYDLAWHLRGGPLTTSVATVPWQFPAPVQNGYNGLDNVARATTDTAWVATITTPNHKTVRLLAPGAPGVEIITGTGHFFTKKPSDDEAPPTLIERRTAQNEVLYGTVVDISGDTAGYVKSVAQKGSLREGYGILAVQTQQGRDLCFTSFAAGIHRVGDMETDAKQAFVRSNGGNVIAIYLAGGTTIASGGARLTRNTPGLAYVEQTKPGTFVAGNPSSGDATISIAMPVLKGLSAFNLDAQQKRIGPADVSTDKAGLVELHLKAGERVEFSAQ